MTLRRFREILLLVPPVNRLADDYRVRAHYCPDPAVEQSSVMRGVECAAARGVCNHAPAEEKELLAGSAATFRTDGERLAAG